MLTLILYAQPTIVHPLVILDLQDCSDSSYGPLRVTLQAEKGSQASTPVPHQQRT